MTNDYQGGWMMMKRAVLTTALCGVMTFSLIGCAASDTSSGSTEGSSSTSSDTAVNMENPWNDYASMEEAEAAAGFTLALPFEIVASDEFRVIPDEILEVVHPVGGGVTVRKAVGADDPSGDYNTYPYVTENDGITFKGDSEDEIYLVTWTDGGYAYAIMVGDALPTTKITAMANKTQ